MHLLMLSVILVNELNYSILKSVNYILNLFKAAIWCILVDISELPLILSSNEIFTAKPVLGYIAELGNIHKTKI